MRIQTRIVTFFFKLGVGVTSAENLLKLKKQEVVYRSNRAHFELVDSLSEDILSSFDVKSLSKVLSRCTSQLGQDLIALALTDCKRNGFFVEFGATNGKDLSNTFVLEKDFGWKGILAEPAKSFHRDLKINRNCEIETDCIWRESNVEILFNEVPYLELSTIEQFSSGDAHSESRKLGRRYKVKTISLIDLLVKYDAPNMIDYLSIDTEGSEFEILRDFDFSKYQINFISCEHNFTQNREQVQQLLEGNGYKRVLTDLSRFDDWYVHHSLFKAKGLI
jgi:FkbM family methyltransferase